MSLMLNLQLRGRDVPLCEPCAPQRSPQEHQRFSRPWKSSDLILQVEDREFHVHRAVLMVCSPVFEAMLSSEFKEKSAKKNTTSGQRCDRNRADAARYLS